ncbi:RNA polymerase sigma factor [Bacteroides sp.]|uniref:RNA polymerase sigma factor n=1 Tax=Bacteroides sp. TaxID=29523 RepID=UPI0025BB5B7F|nr:RNA polymerase sigma-70 factor [Bacteroides sp.]
MDKKNLERLRLGSYRDFDALYKMYAGNLYGFALGLTRSADLAGNIVQDTFIKVWINRESVDPELSFKSYLFKIARNLIIDEFRRRLNEPLFEDYLDYCEEAALSAPTEIERKLDFDLFVEELTRAKEKLTLRQREIFELSKEEGLTSSEIADKLGISEQTVYNQLSTSLRILKKEISSTLLFFFTLFFS